MLFLTRMIIFDDIWIVPVLQVVGLLLCHLSQPVHKNYYQVYFEELALASHAIHSIFALNCVIILFTFTLLLYTHQ